MSALWIVLGCYKEYCTRAYEGANGACFDVLPGVSYYRMLSAVLRHYDYNRGTSNVLHLSKLYIGFLLSLVAGAACLRPDGASQNHRSGFRISASIG